ncbi:hypothetical protein CAPTEDRAFT_219768 [Capitella teleta]|uniref:C2 domain-containing protein n=1 Tax=Capitella teleta TaxID=283909 RepID=R7V8F8_CAPTE|nr:hypothetical protein CAPTEDRAFT_219768 [Capitella teleta]|eukprot:ELU12045.1 hypothetical protein CAPTEDRAFT_219768 [Capitella teleta]
MADITLKLIWYRLGESYKNVGVKYDRFLEWCEDFSWSRVDILDMLFLGWLLLAFVVVAAINLYLRFFGLPKYRKGRLTTTGPVSLVTGAEKADWLNAVIAWIHGHYRNTPEIIDTWLRALSEEAKHHAVGEYQMRFDRIQSGCPPPRITKVATDASSPDSMTVRADVECSECVLQVALIQQTATSVKVSNCDVSLTKLSGQLRLHGTCVNEEIQLAVGFVAPPQMTVTAKPRNYDANLDQRLVENMVRSAVAGALLNMALPSHGGFPTFFAASHLKANGSGPLHNQQQQQHSQAAMAQPLSMPSPSQHGSARLRRNQHKSPVLGTLSLVGSVSNNAPTARASRVHEAPIQPSSMTPVSAAPGSKSLQGRRLLVKVIKANGLGDKDFGNADPYCVVLLDEPIQKHTTSVVRNTVNPFWDEHFIFFLDDLSRQVQFEVYSHGKAIEDEFMGRAFVLMDELRRMPSSRQIIPLTGRPRAATSTSGSITVEFLFMEGPHDSQVSPKRRIETSRMMVEGGTMVTTTTTTTEKPKDHQMLNSPFHHDMPSQIEKTDLLSRGPGGVGSMQSDYPYARQSTLGAHDAALNASQGSGVTEAALRELDGAPSPVQKPKSTTLIITSVQRDSSTLPSIQTNDLSPYDDGGRDDDSMRASVSTLLDDPSPPPPMRKPRAEVKKSKSFASTLKKRFARPKKSRSQSADRAQTSSLREGSLLKPPSHQQQQQQHRTDDDLDQGEFADGRMRKSRSHSFSSSLRKLFKGGKKGSGRKDASRESSLSRLSGRNDASREGSIGIQNSPDMSYNNRDLRHSTPTPDYDQSNYPYSMSVPQGASPLYDH